MDLRFLMTHIIGAAVNNEISNCDVYSDLARLTEQLLINANVTTLLENAFGMANSGK